MTKLDENLLLDRCPHCRVDRPNLTNKTTIKSTDHAGRGGRTWRIYQCARCGGLVLAAAQAGSDHVSEVYPTPVEIDTSIPERPRTFLSQAIDTIHAPSGSIMLSASAVDSMLKLKGYSDGTLYGRIDKAAHDHVITTDMASWAHEVRLDANDQRHADTDAPLPSEEDARRVVEFAMALAQIMFVLPSRVARGIESAKRKSA